MTYLIGVDGGSQSTKVVIHDLAGRVVAEGREPLRPMHMPAPGVVEHPDDDLWASLVAAGRKAMAGFAATGGDPADIRGLGLCTIRFCRALLRQDGSLAAPVMSWMDARVSRPYAHDDPAVRYVTTSSGYLTHRLTGRLRDTAANYQGQWPMDTDAWAWADPSAVPSGGDLEPGMLAELVLPGEVLGTLSPQAAAETGFPAGLPVVATANDKAVEALGCGLVDEDVALVSLGTYIAAMVTGRSNPKDSAQYWTNFACLPHEYLHESHGIRRGMWTVSWLRDLLGQQLVTLAGQAGLSVEQVMDAAAADVPPGSDGLMTVLDWLAPVEAPHRKGVMLGFDQRHGWPHLYRSVLEGIALTMRDRVAAMCDELGRPLSRLLVSGGGSSGDTMMQAFADVFDLPAARPAAGSAAGASAAGLGASICAAVGVGLQPDLRTAAARMASPLDVFTPRPDAVELYDRLVEVYRTVPGHTDPVLAQSYRIFH